MKIAGQNPVLRPNGSGQYVIYGRNWGSIPLYGTIYS
nr:MAG TPA: hypothetical protein [Caudoviricetes sp.]